MTWSYRKMGSETSLRNPPVQGVEPSDMSTYFEFGVSDDDDDDDDDDYDYDYHHHYHHHYYYYHHNIS